jgi:Mg-chelatase subunit ChlD/tRNA A-37 threonylcarbamoyl transferase component Bud32
VTDEIPAGELGPGAHVAGYLLEQLLGQGGMAVVYRAYDGRLDRRVALKLLAPELSSDRSFRERFMRESRAAAAVDHPSILPIFDAGEAAGILFIAMRLVGGGDVRALIERQGPLPVPRALHIVTQMASALDAAHARKLVHRDVKPANMLRDAAGGGTHVDHVYLSDFGLSKLTLAARGLTSQSQFLGTLDYMSPEQIEGGAVDGRTDQYALACSAFEMLTGAPPFKQNEQLAVMWAQVSADPPSVTSRRGDLSAAADEVMARALAKVAGDRYGSCLEFAAALRRALGPAPGTVISGPAAPARSRGPAPRADQVPAAAAPRASSAGVRSDSPMMPGGGVARRPLHFIVLADCSGSMVGDKMQALNSALRGMLPPLVSWQQAQVQAQLLIRVLGFATEPRWHVAEPLPPAELARRWQDLERVPGGRTNMGAAFLAVAEVLAPGRLERRALRPALLLITDGLPTDPPGVFDAELAALLGSPAGRSALRLAIAIGRDANSDAVARFRSPGIPELVADGVEEIADRLLVASMMVSRMSEPGAGQQVLTRLRPA